MNRATPLYDSNLPENHTEDLVPEVRDLFSEHPVLQYREPDTVRRALWTLRRVAASEFEIESALEALQVEGELAA